VQNFNEQKNLEKIIEDISEAGRTPRLLLHSCCAPCSSYVLEYLSNYFEITDFYYNPNITEKDEYQKRSQELQRLISRMPLKNPVAFVEGRYDPDRFFKAVRGHESDKEGGRRCELCFRLRLEEAARLAACDPAVLGSLPAGSKEAFDRPFDYFTTTLTISPLKNTILLNAIGREMAEKYGVAWLPSDFKKRGGYQRSIILSKEYNLYRQNYCGCLFSKRDECDKMR